MKKNKRDEAGALTYHAQKLRKKIVSQQRKKPNKLPR